MRSRAPGRVNLIGDHTDYTGGYVVPMAIDRATEVTWVPGGGTVELRSEVESDPAVVALDVDDPAAVRPDWARYVAGVVATMRPARGGTGRVRSTVPVGAGLASSAALEVAVALALGFTGSPVELALLCQQGEQRASGVPCGVMDQLASAAGVAGHALLIDCESLEVAPVPLPADVEVIVVHSGQSRTLAGSRYGERRRQCDAAAAAIGPLREATVADLAGLDDPVLRRRARHVVTENERALAFAACLRSGDLATAGELMNASHRSLRDDFEVSTGRLDELVGGLAATPGVFGARLTGAGFGGCAVALAEAGSPAPGWRMAPSSGATVTST